MTRFLQHNEKEYALLDEDQIFELIVCAAIGQATRQYEAALVALDETMADQQGREHAPEDSQ